MALNWNRPRGRGHTGGTVVRGASSDELAQMRRDREQMRDSYIGRKHFFGMKILREKAAAGDRAAQVKLLKGQARSHMLREPARKKSAAKWAAWRAEQVPKGYRRIKKQDPTTGEWHELDLKIGWRVFEDVMLAAQRRKARTDLVTLESWEWEFLLYGRAPKPRED